MQNSLWLSGIETVPASGLTDSINCEICIIGGGLTGVYTAYLLAKKGLKVVLLEANASVALAATGHSTGKLTPQHGVVFSKLLKAFSKDEVRTYFDANKSAIESAIQNATVEVYQKADSYLYATTDQGKQTLQDEMDAYKKLGLPGTETTETELSFTIEAAIKIENTHQIHPTNFTLHFARLAVKEGASIYVNTRITKVVIDKNYVQTENKLLVNYKHLVLATHYPIESVKRLLTVKLQVERSYLIATKTSELLKGQYLSAESSSRTIRTALVNNTPYFIYGGTSHKAGADKNTLVYYETLKKELTSVFDLPSPEFLWSAQDPNTADSIPYVGRIASNEPNIYVATGYQKWGLSNSLVAGEIISTGIISGRHAAADIYNPARNQFGRTFLRMLTVIGFITTSLAGGYLTRLEAPKCTHMGCKTRWNEGDETWDCPCHGSRYDRLGNVIEGPAVYPLDLSK